MCQYLSCIWIWDYSEKSSIYTQILEGFIHVFFYYLYRYFFFFYIYNSNPFGAYFCIHEKWTQFYLFPNAPVPLKSPIVPPRDLRNHHHHILDYHMSWACVWTFFFYLFMYQYHTVFNVGALSHVLTPERAHFLIFPLRSPYTLSLSFQCFPSKFVLPYGHQQ